MTTKRPRYAPHWLFVQPGQLWFDYRADLIWKVTERRRGSFWATAGKHGQWSWKRTSILDNTILSGWVLLT